MTVKLRNLDKTINRFKKKVIKVLETGTVPNEIGTQIREDILQKMRTSRITDGKGGTKAAPPLTAKTKRFYRSKGVRTKPLFQFAGDLIKQIKTRFKSRKIIIGPSTAEARKKIRILNSDKTKGGKTKARRPIMQWTRVRTNIIRRIIRNAIKRNFN